jgi:hypothetical protein
MRENVELSVANRLHDPFAHLFRTQSVLDQITHEVIGVARERAAEALWTRPRGEMNPRINRRRTEH